MGGVGETKARNAELARAAGEEIVEPVIEAMIPAYPPIAKGGRRQGSNNKGVEIIETRGMADSVIWLRACGWSNRAIARHLGVSSATVDRFTRRPDFEAMVERTALDVTSRVNEAIRHRSLNVLTEALETKIQIMRDKKTNAYLRDKVASDLIVLAREFIQEAGISGKGGEGDLKAMMEMIQMARGKDGTRTTKRITLTGSPAAVAAAAASAPGPGNDAGPGGEGARADDSPSSGLGSERPA